MSVRLGTNQYGKAETHLVRVYRDGDVHTLRDLTVSVALSGNLDAVHLEGDNAAVLATDTQKNTVYAFAKEAPIGEPEDFALRLGRHFLGGAITRARVEVREAPWTRIGAHAFTQAAREVRVAVAVCEPEAEWVLSGLEDLVVLKTTDSEFHGFPRDRYTTLKETRDRVLATAVSARWRHPGDASYDDARAALVETFAAHHSLSLQQTLYAMGEALLEACPTRRRGAAVDAQQASLRRGPGAVRAGEPERGLPRRRPPVRADRGRRHPRRRPRPGPVWDPYPLI